MQDTEIIQKFNKGNSPGQPALTYPLTEVPTYENKLHSPIAAESDFVPLLDKPYVTLGDSLEVAAAVRQTLLKQWPSDYAVKYNLGTGIAEPLVAARVENSLDLARLVGMDKPTDLYNILNSWILDNAGAERHVDQLAHTEFLEHTIGDVHKMVSLIDAALRRAFEEKWYWGLCRPEESLAPFVEVSLYPEGCPNHPSYPAGHGTVAGVVYAFLTSRYRLNKKQHDMIELSARQFAHGRTFAGVHYAIDNDAGFMLGVSVALEHGYHPAT